MYGNSTWVGEREIILNWKRSKEMMNWPLMKNSIDEEQKQAMIDFH